MKRCVLHRPGLVEFEEIPDLEPGPEEIVVSVRGALTCGTDLKMYRQGHPMVPLPTPFGHEFSGVVEKCGAGITAFSEGQEIMAVHTGPCGECSFCVRGHPQLCTALMDTKVMGSFAEQVLLPRHVADQNVFPKPPELPFTEAALLEPLACVVHGVDSLGLREGQTAVVIGAGPIGLLHTAYLKHLGLVVTVAGRGRERLQAARSLGADRVLESGGTWVESLREEIGDEGADYVFECTGRPEVWEGAVWVARRGGTVTLFGGCPPGTQVMFDAARLHYDAITLRGVFHFAPDDVRRARDLLVSGTLKLGVLITAEYPLYQIETVLDRLVRGEGIKFALVP